MRISTHIGLGKLEKSNIYLNIENMKNLATTDRMETGFFF